MTITEIKNAVQKLSTDEQKELFEWLDELRDNQWDQQIEKDLQSIYLEQKDVLIFKDKLSQKSKSTKHLNHWKRKEQLPKNQPLMDLINKWLQQKTDQISTPEEEQEYKDVQAELLKSRM